YATSSSDEEALTKVCGAKTNGPVQGYDVSIYQGAFTWAGKGVQFGIARISDGVNNIDPQFDGNWSRMKAAGVLRAAYQFFEPGQDEVAQAKMVIAKVGKLGAGDLPVMLDIEVTGGQSPTTIRTKAQHWLDLVEAKTGKRPFVYSYGSFLETNLGSGFGKYPLAIANYGATCPSVPNGWTNWVMWQYSDGGGKLDHDVFNGTLAQLQALAGATASGSDDPCASFVDGYYCAASPQFKGGKVGDFYECRGGATKSKQTCTAGCEVSPPGVPDICHQGPAGVADAGVPSVDASVPSDGASSQAPQVATNDGPKDAPAEQPSDGCSISSRGSRTSSSWLLFAAAALGTVVARRRTRTRRES
ncbi:MAG: GH25 family lysozyme, partial [Polyangiaceae bacterium]